MEARTETLHRRCCDDDCLATVSRTKFDEAAIERISGTLDALGDEVRLKIVKLLAQHDSLCVCELQGAFDVGQPTISHHLRVLRDAGLVDVVRRGVWGYYALRREALKGLIQELVKAV